MDYQLSRKDEFRLIAAVAHRAKNELATYPDDTLTLIMDIECAHQQIPLDLTALLYFPLLDFSHDIYGIRQHINRSTGKLEGYFVPRCAA